MRAVIPKIFRLVVIDVVDSENVSPIETGEKLEAFIIRRAIIFFYEYAPVAVNK